MKKDFLNRKNLIYIVYGLTSLIVVLVCIIFYSFNKNRNTSIISRDKNSSFFFTNPILDCENSLEGEENVLSSRGVNEAVENLKEKYNLSHISLYFRDLNNGPWVGINEKEEFSPASLLKVPIMIAFLREAERDPNLLDKKITVLESDINKFLTQNIKFDNLLEIGNTYSLEKINEYMIQKSDNTGVLILLRNIRPDFISGVFRSVGVPYKDTQTEVNLRVKDYAGFFRVLFNSSYLSREMSEKALEVLSKSEYKNGLVKGVPSGVVVAHKFGERTTSGINNKIQLHDCGIIYYPDKPYILCVMTRGDSFINQEKVIEELSRYVYTEINKNNEIN